MRHPGLNQPCPLVVNLKISGQACARPRAIFRVLQQKAVLISHWSLQTECMDFDSTCTDSKNENGLDLKSIHIVNKGITLKKICLGAGLENAMAPHSSTLAWKIPWTEEPAVHGVPKSRTQLSDFTFTFHFHALEKEMATHSSVLAWRIPGTGEPGGRPSMGSHRVGHD